MKLQDFLEKYQLDYSSDDIVARLNDLFKILAQNIMYNKISRINIVLLFKEYNLLQNTLFSEALKNILIHYTDDIRDYEHEAGQSISIIDDDRDSEEFVRIFLEKANS